MATKNVLEVIEKKIAAKAASRSFTDFFKSREGLWVSGSFKERILNQAKDAGVDMTLTSFKLIKDSTDEQIEAALPEKHIFTESEVCAVIAALIEGQPKGEKGILLNDGWYNLFYTEGCVVRVDWSVDEWNVNTWDRDGGTWSAGFRVFSPATDEA